MIECYVGKIGGGKTYFAVQTMCAHLAKGGTVVTNIVLNWLAVAQFILEVYGVEPEPDQYRFLDELPGKNADGTTPHMIEDAQKYVPFGKPSAPVLCVVDEAHLWFDASLFVENKKRFKALREFLSQSRKARVDFIFIAQAWETMDMFIRRQTATVWTTRDMRTFKLLGLNYILGHTFCRTGYDYTLKFEMYPRKFYPRDNRIFKLYDSHAMLKPFETSGEFVEAKKLQKKKGKKKRMLKYVLIFCLVGFVVGGASVWTNLKRFFGDDKPVEQLVDNPAQPVIPQAAPTSEDLTIRETVTSIMAPQLAITRESGIYEVGHPSPHGWVEAVSDGGRVRIRAWDGSTRFVIPAQVSARTPVSTPPPSPALEPVIAKIDSYKLATPLDNHGRRK